MVRQFRYAFGEEIWELPAGKLEAGEDPFEAAKRELSEECGLTADNFIDLGVVYATVGYDSEKIYLWAATSLHDVKQHLDAGEFLDVVKMPFDKALGLVMDDLSGAGGAVLQLHLIHRHTDDPAIEYLLAFQHSLCMCHGLSPFLHFY